MDQKQQKRDYKDRSVRPPGPDQNPMAAFSMVLGIGAIVSLFLYIPSFILGTLAIIIAVLSRGHEEKFHKNAIAGMLTASAALIAAIGIGGAYVFHAFSDDLGAIREFYSSDSSSFYRWEEDSRDEQVPGNGSPDDNFRDWYSDDSYDDNRDDDFGGYGDSRDDDFGNWYGDSRDDDFGNWYDDSDDRDGWDDYWDNYFRDYYGDNDGNFDGSEDFWNDFFGDQYEDYWEDYYGDSFDDFFGDWYGDEFFGDDYFDDWYLPEPQGPDFL